MLNCGVLAVGTVRASILHKDVSAAAYKTDAENPADSWRSLNPQSELHHNNNYRLN